MITATNTLGGRMNKIKKYDDLKFEFYQALRAKKFNKGDLRALVSLRTWINEAERLKANEDTVSAHLSALGEALNDLNNAIDRCKFQEVFRDSLALWIGSKKTVLDRNSIRKPLVLPPIPHMSDWKANGLNQVSLFSGALGLDLGFLAAGFDLKFTNDIAKYSFDVVKQNLPSVHFELKDFADVKSEEVLDAANLRAGEVDVLTGGPPCQPFSTAGKRRGLSDPRASPLKEFIRAIEDIRPRAFVMEEVTGLMSSRLEHVPISERGGKPLTEDQKKGSVFKVVLKMLSSTGYTFTYGVLNAADFGSPQCRNRVIFIGLREGKPTLPKATHSNVHQKDLSENYITPWSTLWEATADLQGKEQEYIGLSDKTKRYMRYVPPGGYWRHLPEDKIEEAMGGAYKSGGGKMGYYRRLSWDEPSPTVVTSPTQKGTMFGHPEDMRPLSIDEYKRIQGFPDDWKLIGSLSDRYKMVGDAVSVHLSYAIAKHVKSLLGSS